MLVDEINDRVGYAYRGMPGRLNVLDRDGWVAYKGGGGPFGFKPGEMEQTLVMLVLGQAELAETAAIAGPELGKARTKERGCEKKTRPFPLGGAWSVSTLSPVRSQRRTQRHRAARAARAERAGECWRGRPPRSGGPAAMAVRLHLVAGFAHSRRTGA